MMVSEDTREFLKNNRDTIDSGGIRTLQCVNNNWIEVGN